MKNDADVLNALLKGKIIDMVAADGTVYCSWWIENETVVKTNSRMPYIPMYDETLHVRTGLISIEDF